MNDNSALFFMEVWSKAELRVQFCVDAAWAMMCEQNRVKSSPRAW